MGSYRWGVCFATFMHFVLFEGVFFTFGLMFVELSDTFGTRKGATAWITSINFAASLIVGPFASTLCKSFGYWTVAILGTLLACLGLLTSTMATNIAMLYVTYGFLAGIGNGLIFHASIVCVLLLSGKQQALSNGICTCGIGVGMFIISPMAEWCMNLYGWRGTILVETGLLLNGIAVGLVLKPLGTLGTECVTDPPNSTQKQNGQVREHDGMYPRVVELSVISEINSVPIKGICQTTSDSAAGHRICNAVGVARFRFNAVRFLLNSCGIALLTSPAFAVYSVSSFLTFFAVNMPLFFIPDLAKTKGIDGYHGAWLLSAAGITSTVCKIGFGYLADQLGMKRFMLQGTFLVMSGLFTALMPVCNTFELLLIDIVLFSTFQGCIPDLVSILVGDLVGQKKLSQGFGLVCWFAGFGNLIGPPIAGWLCDISGNYMTSFWTSGLVLVTSGLLVFVTPCVKGARRV